MYNQYQPQGFPISVSFITKNRTLYKEKINSKSSFNTLLENFKKNSQYQSQAKLKNKHMECMKLQLVIGKYQEQDNYGKKHIHTASDCGQKVCGHHKQSGQYQQNPVVGF